MRYLSKITFTILTLVFMTVPAFAAHIEINAAAGNPGGTFYIGMGAVGQVITSNNPDIEYSIFPSGGFTNVIRVANNSSQIAIAQDINILTGINGLEPFKKSYNNLRGLVGINHLSRTHIVVAASTGITDIAQIKAKKIPLTINMNTVGGNNEYLPRKVLEEYGITYKDIRDWGGKIFALSLTNSIDMMKDGRIKADTHHGDDPVYKYMDIKTAIDLRVLPLSKEVQDRLVKKYGLKATSIPAASYGTSEDILTVGTRPEIFTNTELSDDLAYRITKAIIENRKDIAIALPAWQIDPETAWQNLSAPLHPGAERYYREMGYMK